MFDVGWSEMGLIVGAAIVLTRPEDMPGLLYKLGKAVRKLRLFTADIQKSLDRVMEEAEVDDLARTINSHIGGPQLQFEIDRQAEEEHARQAGAPSKAQKKDE